jgi:polysaccharide export outer membrane protein
VALLVAAFAVSSCGLPRVGPNKREIFAGSVQKQGNAYIISVNDRVVEATALAPAAGFSEKFLRAGKIGADTIQPGDTLLVTVYENVDDGLFSTAGAPSTLTQLQVDQTGHIFIPYVGRIRAAGSSPEALRRLITRKLEPQTPEPQVIVQRAAGDGATVSIIGVGGQGVFPIEASTSTLSTMIAKSGGISTNPENTRVTVIRGKYKGTVWLEDLFNKTGQDIALRPNDRILIQEDKRRFTALGATGGQSLVEFPKPTMSAIEAIAFLGGLNSSTADPTGIFIFRDETAEFANKVLGRNDFVTPKRFAYVLDLTEPTGVFLGRDFQMRDGDTIYVTEAPYVQWTKTLSVLTTSTSAAGSLSTATGG